MKENAFKFFGLLVFAFVFNLNVNAQSQPSYGTTANAPLTPAQKLELKIQRLTDTAERLKMTDAQTDRYVSSTLEFDNNLRKIKTSKAGKDLRKTRIQTLTENHNASLASYLSEKQYAKVAKKIKGKKKAKR